MICQIRQYLLSFCSVGLSGCICQLEFGCIPFLGTSALLVLWPSSFSTCQSWPCSTCLGTSWTTTSGVSGCCDEKNKVLYMCNPLIWLPSFFSFREWQIQKDSRSKVILSLLPHKKNNFINKAGTFQRGTVILFSIAKSYLLTASSSPKGSATMFVGLVWPVND